MVAIICRLFQQISKFFVRLNSSSGKIPTAWQSTQQNDRTECYWNCQIETYILPTRYRATKSNRPTFADISGFLSRKILDCRLLHGKLKLCHWEHVLSHLNKKKSSPGIVDGKNWSFGYLLTNYDIVDGCFVKYNFRSWLGRDTSTPNVR